MDVRDYDWFSIGTFAPQSVHEQVEALRAEFQFPMRPMIPAHVTLRGTFDHVVDLGAILDVVRVCASRRKAGQIRADRLRVGRRDDRSTIVLLAEVTPEIEALHWDLLDAMRDLCAPASTYVNEESAEYHPHLTIVQNIDAATEARALPAVERLALSYAFVAAEASVMGRRGGTAWETLASFPIGPGTTS